MLLDILLPAFPQHGEDARDVAPRLAELGRVLELLGHRLGTQVEQVSAEPFQLVVQLIGLQCSEGLHLSHRRAPISCVAGTRTWS